MNSNKKYCLFPKPHLTHLLFLFYFLSSVVKQYILKGIKKDKANFSIPIFKLYIHEIGDFLSIIPYIILKIKTKSHSYLKKLNTYNKINTYFKRANIFKKMLRKIIIFIFIISFIDFIAQISTAVFYLIEGSRQMQVNHGNTNIVLIFNVIFLFILSKYILDIKFYSHHYFSFIIFIICLIAMGIIDFINIVKESKDFINSLLYILIRIFSVLLYSIVNVIDKVVFLKYFISPYFLLLSKAIIQLFFLIIFSIPFCFVKFNYKNKEEKIIFSMFSMIFEQKLAILFYIIYIISSFFYNLLNLLIINKFSPENVAIAFILESFGLFIIGTANKEIKLDYNFGIKFIMHILLIIGSFIFNEFIVINICGLANNTKLFLDYKEKRDLSLINGSVNENTSSENLSKSVNEEINSNASDEINSERD